MGYLPNMLITSQKKESNGPLVLAVVGVVYLVEQMDSIMTHFASLKKALGFEVDEISLPSHACMDKFLTAGRNSLHRICKASQISCPPSIAIQHYHCV